jgi:peptidoglycan/LPS O-acetylase OafA/YrhL
VFISGFFLHAVYREKFVYAGFVLKKIRYVALPYLSFSAFVIFLKMSVWILYFGHSFEVASQMMLAQAARGYVLGAYWYVPFIMLTFLMAPLHMRFLESKSSLQGFLMLASLIVSALIHRSVDNENVLQSAVYYTPFYLLGIFYSQNLRWFAKNSHVVMSITGLLVVALLILQSYVVVHAGNYYKPALEYGGLDLMALQKFFLCVFLAEFFRFIAQHHELPASRGLAESSFAIYFLHGIILEFYKILWGEFAKSGGYEAVSIESSSLGFLLALIGSYYAAKVLKSILGKNSRVLIGW